MVVSYSAEGAEAWLRVSGCCGGIPEADLPRLFDVAYRGSAARTMPRAGREPAGGATAGGAPAGGAPVEGEPVNAGLGLAIARGLVEAHRGRIEARNTGPGCLFEIRLPLAVPGAG